MEEEEEEEEERTTWPKLTASRNRPSPRMCRRAERGRKRKEQKKKLRKMTIRPQDWAPILHVLEAFSLNRMPPDKTSVQFS